MPDIFDPYHGNEPFSADDERPYFVIGTDQLRKMVEYLEDFRGTLRVEYGGAGYWFVQRLTPEGEPSEDRLTIFPIEVGPEARR